MSGRIALRDELTKHSRRQAERTNSTRRATVTAVAPLTVQFFNTDMVLTEDDDFWLSQWATFYNSVVGIVIDDVVLLHEQEDWVLFDVITDTDVAKAFNDWKAA
jgi:hypothetical protein